ncbi:MAG: hypothetical protein AAF245_01395 [Pseudomonadota bacterium]
MAEVRARLSTRSRVVGLLKVVFPLTAVGLLALVFLWQAEDDLGGGLTFSNADLEAMATGLKLSQPQFSGASMGGDIYDFRARTVVPRDIDLTMADIEALDGRVLYADGRVVELTSETAEIDLENRKVVLQTGIVITTSDGYRAKAERLDVDVSAAILEATGPIEATGPVGRITAGRMTIAPAEGFEAPVRVNETLTRFSGGVKLTYTPGLEGND